MTALLNAAGICKRFGTLEVLKEHRYFGRLRGVPCACRPIGLRQIDLAALPQSAGTDRRRQHHIRGCRNRRYPRRQAAFLRRRMGMVFQNFELFPHLSAEDNIAFGPIRVKQTPRREARELAGELLRRVHLPDKAHAFPDELSGGQQQRVAIARALAMEPALMLYDEPTSALDPETVGEVLNVMQELSEAGMTSIAVTHELAFARRAANEIVFMEAGQIEHRAPVEAFFDADAPERVVRFLRRMHG